ncbi:amidohydrolase [Motilimonas pumila]|uniref:Amidohydrolase 3 domain-containing protein n=1 Tax=Motilimonas pumila TaxID=2303987 RepID=A0A418YFW4_9GAMM|nr:amidohydrolase family protein [Motilimonas pumila]RJG48199.1 hypothetical protein D1Z90_09025 [Motilimonas pumila]
MAVTATIKPIKTLLNVANTACKSTVLMALALLIQGCEPKPKTPLKVYDIPFKQADLIFKNGHIITMEGLTPKTVPAISVVDGRIQSSGMLADVSSYLGDNTQVIDLQGHTLMPGFIQAHGQFSTVMQMIDWVNLAAPPMGEITDIAAALTRLQQVSQQRQTDTDEWIIAWGYDPALVQQQRHITRQELDQVFPHHKVMVIAAGGNGAVLNSHALEWAGFIDDDVPSPIGGNLGQTEPEPDSDEPSTLNGYVDGSAFIPLLAKLPLADPQQKLKHLIKAQQYYFSKGYTSAMAGSSHIEEIEFLSKAASANLLALDVFALAMFYDEQQWQQWQGIRYFEFGKAKKNLKIQGVKIIFDGPLQRGESLLSFPYAKGKATKEVKTLTKGELQTLMQLALDNHVQVFVEAHGDAAAEIVISSQQRLGITGQHDRRTVIMHSQVQEQEQMVRQLKLGISPVFSSSELFFSGQTMLQYIGPKQAKKLAPLGQAQEIGLIYGNFGEFQQMPLSPLQLLLSATYRHTRDKRVISPSNHVTVYQGLKAMTSAPAYFLFEEQRLGKIKPGFAADLVVLNGNPLLESGHALAQIEVLETYKDGKLVFENHPVKGRVEDYITPIVKTPKNED